MILDSLYHTCQCYSKRLTLVQNDQLLCWFQNLSTSSLDALIISTFGIPLCSLLLTQTTTNITDARHCNPNPSSRILPLLNMHPNSRARIPQVLIIPWRCPFMSPLQSYLAKLLAQWKDYHNQPSSTTQKNSSLPL